MIVTPNLDKFDHILRDGGQSTEFPIAPPDVTLSGERMESVAFVAVVGDGGSIRVCPLVDYDLVLVPTFFVHSDSVDGLLTKIERQASDFIAASWRGDCEQVRLVRVIKTQATVIMNRGVVHAAVEHGFLCTARRKVRSDDSA